MSFILDLILSMFSLLQGGTESESKESLQSEPAQGSSFGSNSEAETDGEAPEQSTSADVSYAKL